MATEKKTDRNELLDEEVLQVTGGMKEGDTCEICGKGIVSFVSDPYLKDDYCYVRCSNCNRNTLANRSLLANI